MIYRFHRKLPISQGMTAQPKNLHISGKCVGQLFVGKCTDVIWEFSKIQWWVFCDVFLQILCFHRNCGLICTSMGCNFLWRATCYHTCFPFNSSSFPGCCPLSDESNVTKHTTLIHPSAWDITEFHFKRLTLPCVLQSKYCHGFGPGEGFFFFFFLILRADVFMRCPNMPSHSIRVSKGFFLTTLHLK